MAAEKKAMQLISLKYDCIDEKCAVQIDEDITYHYDSSEIINDKIFFLSASELVNYFPGGKSSRATGFSPSSIYSGNYWWWLRSPTASSETAVGVIAGSGRL